MENRLNQTISDSFWKAERVAYSAWAATTKCHKLVLINNTHLFLTIQEAGKYKIKWQQIRCLVRTAIWFTSGHLLAMALHSRRNKGALESLLQRALIPLMRAPPSDLIPAKRLHLLISSHWGREFTIWIYANTSIQSVAAGNGDKNTENCKKYGILYVPSII